MNIKKLTNYVTDIRIIGGMVVTVIGVVVWVAISWTSLLGRVGAVESVQSERTEISKDVSKQLGELKIQQSIQGEQITSIKDKINETNSLIKELLRLFKK